MRIDQVKDDFERHLAVHGISLETIDAATSIRQMLSWYEDARVEDAAPVTEDGDMMLFQWGTYDWGHGRWFEYNLTRQVISADFGGDESIWQLELTLRYTPTSETGTIGSGNRWWSKPAAVDGFREFIENSEASEVVAMLKADETELRFGIAG